MEPMTKDLDLEDFDLDALKRCPHCTGKYRGRLREGHISLLDPRPGRNAMSRRDKTTICTACARAEALADQHSGLDDGMARTVIENDRQEAMRLPESFPPWGQTQWPTGKNHRLNKLTVGRIS